MPDIKRNISAIPRKIQGLYEIRTDYKGDERGGLVSFFDKKTLKKFGIANEWVAEYLSFTRSKNTVRGLHVSLPPNCESKLVMATRGITQWVVVDLRRGSKTFGGWDSIVLSEEGHNAFFVARGFAHGCVSLSENAELLIKADNYFSEEESTGIAWNDPDLNIKWGLNNDRPILSNFHQKYANFKDFVKNFGGLDV